MCFFWKRKKKQNTEGSTSPVVNPQEESKKQRLNRECGELCAELDVAIGEANSYFANPNSYIEISTRDFWVNKYTELNNKLTPQLIASYKKASSYKDLCAKHNMFMNIPERLKGRISIHNDSVARGQIPHGYSVIGDVEGRRLDEQQMVAVLKPSNNHLIIAGAGTGKTTTVVGKIKYILAEKYYKPEDILVLSFTNASASEMSERIRKETKEDIEASTFHKLGLNIIQSVEGKVPKIYSAPLTAFIKEQLQNLMGNFGYLNALCGYAIYHRSPIREKSEFANEDDYYEYMSGNAPRTLGGEDVKSYGEMDIANFLYQNGIRYQYEASYQIDTNTAQYGQYHPDFYLPDYKIYIEYFGINRAGEVADYFRGRDGLSASQTYRQSMEWKRKLHAQHNTSMIECFAYEKFEGTLLTELERKLKEKGVVLHPLSPEEVWNKVADENVGILEGIIELFNTVINLTKSNNYTIEQLEQKAASGRNSADDLLVINLLKPIFQAYNQMLAENHEIDFNDMINNATKYVMEGKYVNPYKYVIVDEYQDISKARFNLLWALRQSFFYELFCVGDDWQSIYRFAGSDINYIVDFEKYWGPAEIGRIETTYRFTNSLIAISSDFVMENPRQLKKSICGKSPDNSFSLGLISGYTDKNAVQFMTERFNDLPKDSSVFLLGRYSFDVDILKESGDLRVFFNNATKEIEVTYYRRKDLKIRFLTAHKSKGLQADYVFIINNKNTKMGFPSKIMDASILDLLLEAKEAYPHAEERRLFYVALTRAKKKVFLLTLKDRESEFARELMSKHRAGLNQERFLCPECGGRLVKKSGPYGEFMGCSNYSTLGCKYKRKIGGKKEG